MRLVTAEEMREIDARAARDFGIPSLVLMENAGSAVARKALQTAPCGGRFGVYCGKGNNGGDGLAAARHLANSGAEVRIFLAADAVPTGDAALNFEIAQRMRLPIERLKTAPRKPWPADLVIDAVLGTGIRGELSGGAEVLATAVRRSEAHVLAVDLPSGLDSDTGRLASASVRATLTMTLGLAKLGLALYPGREAAGAVEVAPIGIPRALLEVSRPAAEWLDPESVRASLPRRDATAHKGDAGRVFVLAGSEGMLGAAVMAAEAAVRGGAGLVTLGLPRGIIAAAAARLTEVMTFPLPETETHALDWEALEPLLEKCAGSDAIATGPGLGRHPRTGELLRALLRRWERPLVLDADGLNLLSPGRRGEFTRRTVLTPHPGELARLLDVSAAEIEADRVAAVRKAARQFGCVCLLKGAATLVAEPGGRLAVNSTGTAAMATGGCGDVLTGLIAALLGQGMAPFAAAAAGAWLHGRAGELAAAKVGGIGMAATDLLHTLPAARAEVSGP